MTEDFPGLHELVDQAMNAGERPRTHGNGYIQLNAAPYQVHFWGHPSVPRQKVSTQIHDHSFGFVSHIAQGRVFNLTYLLNESVAGNHRLWKPKMHAREDTLEPTDTYVWCIPDETQQLREGDEYSMDPFVFHELFTPAGERAVTIVKKTQTTNSFPRIVVPSGIEPDKKYDRYGTPAVDLWMMIREYL